jgi:error-prone DNA polymerase
VAFVELHCHSAYSFLDGASHPEELAARAAELGYEALALTDHDGVYGSLEFAYAAKTFGVRPITGAEITLSDGSHVTLLVESPRGYANLCRLLTAAHAGTRPKPAAKRPVRESGPVEGVWGNREVPQDTTDASDRAAPQPPVRIAARARGRTS